MYKIYSDGYKIYDSRISGYKIFNAKLDLELNKTGAFTFTIYPDSPNFDRLIKLKSIITVYQDDYLIFRGRILNTEEGFYNEKQVICEGELAFLLDSIIRPYGSETSPWIGTPLEYLTKLITEHNAQVDEWKQFQVGVVTVTDGDTTNVNNQINRYDTEYKTPWDLITNKLVNQLGGYLWVDYDSNGDRQINYLADFDTPSNQKIEFGKNLLNIKKTVKGEDVMSGIIPLGAKVEGSDTRTTIAGDNEGLDYLEDAEAVAAYGKIYKTVVWDDVTDVSTLKDKGQKYLDNAKYLNSSIELSAADVSGITSVNSFRLGTKIEVKDNVHGLKDIEQTLKFLVKKLSLDIMNPANNTLTLNTTYKTFTESTSTAEKTQGEIVEKIATIQKNIQESGVTKNELDAAIAEVTEHTSSAINQSATMITTQVATDYYLKADATTLVDSINTKFTQTDSEFEFKFNEFSQDLAEVQSGADARFNEINKYIRFINGNIILGEDGNTLTLKIENDRISFLESGAEVAYFSNRKLYVNDGEFINTLALGNFAFVPRANGNVSFKKVK